jgi:hypothetical protein
MHKNKKINYNVYYQENPFFLRKLVKIGSWVTSYNKNDPRSQTFKFTTTYNASVIQEPIFQSTQKKILFVFKTHYIGYVLVEL